jgi:hypothetical protein
VWM